MKQTKIDRSFAFVERHWKLFFCLGLLTLGALWWQQDVVKAWIGNHKPFFEILALVLGPPVTLIGFYLGYRAKREMIEIQGKAAQEAKEFAYKVEQKTASITRLEEKQKLTAANLEQTTISLASKEAELEVERARVDKLDANLKRVSDGGHSLWKAYEPNPFPEYYNWLRDPKGAKIVTVGNLKGGVGKTTMPCP